MQHMLLELHWFGDLVLRCNDEVAGSDGAFGLTFLTLQGFFSNMGHHCSRHLSVADMIRSVQSVLLSQRLC